MTFYERIEETKNNLYCKYASLNNVTFWKAEEWHLSQEILSYMTRIQTRAFGELCEVSTHF